MAVTESLRLYAPGNARMSGCDNCAVVGGFDSYTYDGNNFPEKYVRIGEKPNGERVDIILDTDAVVAFLHGSLLAASKNDGLPMQPDKKAELKEKCKKCEFEGNCYIVDALGRFDD